MSKVLYNPTDERLVGTHGGIDVILEPKAKVEVPDTTANHLVTHFGTRGLVELSFADASDPTRIEAKESEALKRQEKYEKKQVEQYNQINEANKAKSRPYIEPTEDVQRFALKWGIELLQPYTLKDLEKEEISKARKRADEAERRSEILEDKLSKLTDMVEGLMKEKIERDELSKLDKRTKEYKELKAKLEGETEDEE